MIIGKEWFLFLLGIVFIAIASYQDLKKKEVDNWISLSLIVFALGYRFFYSLFTLSLGEGFMFFYQGLIGVGIFFILGNLFYMSRLFAGGDAKLLIALGSVLPLSYNFMENVNYFIYFLAIFLFVGGVYGVITSIVLVIMNYSKFKKKFFMKLKESKRSLYSSLILGGLLIFLGILLILLGISSLLFLALGVMILLFPFLYLYARSVDEVSSVKRIPVSKLSPGDWLHKDVKIGKKTIKANWDGLEESDIKKLKKHKKYVKIKEGIAFVPVFLIGFIIFFLWYSFW